MATTLIDWLYIDDFTTESLPIRSSPNVIQNVTLKESIVLPVDGFIPNLSKQGALIVFPLMIDRWNVASLIVSKWEDYKIVIVTDHPNEFMNIIMNISGTNSSECIPSIKFTTWTDLELIPFPLLRYSDLVEINRALQNTEVDIILFDDARMLAVIAPAIDAKQVYPKIIILTTWGDSMQHLDIVTSKFPELKLLTLKMINDTANIDWQVSRVPMSDRQLRYYDQIRGREISEVSEHVIDYPITRMVTLYAYPDNIMADTISHKYICETDQSTLPDELTKSTWNPISDYGSNEIASQSWLNTSYIETLSDNGPKLLSVIDGIISNWPTKQVVLTRFNHRYGVDLITSFLQLMNKSKKSPYELSEIFHTSCTDEYETSINTFHKFNNSESGVLITNIIPLIPLQNVSIIHVVDSYSFLNINTVLNRVHKRYLNKQGIDIIIYVHIATHPTEKSSDEALYEKLVLNVNEANRIYSGLISMSGSISFDPNSGLIVK